MIRFLLICLGGALGSGARYLFSTGMARAFGRFPFGTLGVNLIGSFLIGLVMVLALEKKVIGPELRFFLTTGVLGGFTTYSSFNHETLQLVQNGTPGLAALNLGATVAGCLVAGTLGLACGRVLGG